MWDEKSSDCDHILPVHLLGILQQHHIINSNSRQKEYSYQEIHLVMKTSDNANTPDVTDTSKCSKKLPLLYIIF